MEDREKKRNTPNDTRNTLHGGMLKVPINRWKQQHAWNFPFLFLLVTHPFVLEAIKGPTTNVSEVQVWGHRQGNDEVMIGTYSNPIIIHNEIQDQKAPPTTKHNLH